MIKTIHPTADTTTQMWASKQHETKTLLREQGGHAQPTKGTIILKDLEEFQSTEFNNKEYTHYEREPKYTEVESGFTESDTTINDNIPAYGLLPGVQGWPTVIAMDQKNDEFVVYMQVLQTGYGLDNVPKNYESQVTLVAILITNGRTNSERRGFMKTMLKDLTLRTYKTEGHMIHAIDMKSDDVLIAENLPHKRWYKMFGIKGLIAEWEAEVNEIFRDNLESLGFFQLLLYVFEKTGKRKLNPVMIKI